ncbi:S1/P1 Nuclease [Terriglobus roseus DSM 18391]|uniref:S1/P1 Nuclease n=1 Tax=Terriglobus roseus (strain DSM 18391 / NRRL B-41598 / KBS 63) TaxID=926566 RepID=I3ZD12_TERRK|nr:S1/P1 nuclease [Terriglobus roseus]AFL87130.1 S1/P1 Nuclease [Terriglobus roseus DSM 18391]
MRKLLAVLASSALLAATLAPPVASAWWEKGHRLVGQIAWDHLTPVARRNVKALLGKESLSDVAAWADVYRPLVTQTGGWHYTDIPGDKTTYDRDRDCPTQPGVKPGSYNDKVRDCATDRILFFESRIADPKLDPSERAESLKFLVHFVGDIHQPFHASGVEKGGNGIQVKAFGQESCGSNANSKCNLHAVWDGYLIDRRNLTDAQYLAKLEGEIRKERLIAGSNNPIAWTEQSKILSDAAIVPTGTNLDEAYYDKNIPLIDRQLELGGLRLAAALNAAFTAPPTTFHPVNPERAK